MTRLLFVLSLVFVLGCDEYLTKPNPKVAGTVQGVRPSNDATMWVAVKIVLTNMHDKDLAVKTFRITWNGGKKTVRGEFRIPHGGQAQLEEIIEPKNGDLTKFLDGTAVPVVEILATGD